MLLRITLSPSRYFLIDTEGELRHLYVLYQRICTYGYSTSKSAQRCVVLPALSIALITNR